MRNKLFTLDILDNTGNVEKNPNKYKYAYWGYLLLYCWAKRDCINFVQKQVSLFWLQTPTFKLRGIETDNGARLANSFTY